MNSGDADFSTKILKLLIALKKSYGEGGMLSEVSREKSDQILVYNRGSGEPEDGKENIFKLIFLGFPW